MTEVTIRWRLNLWYYNKSHWKIPAQATSATECILFSWIKMCTLNAQRANKRAVDEEKKQDEKFTGVRGRKCYQGESKKMFLEQYISFR